MLAITRQMHVPAFAIALFSALAFTAPAAQAVAISERENITNAFRDNPCTGEPVVLDGTIHILAEANASEGGNFHVRLYTNTTGLSGVGSVSGESYTLHDIGHEITQFTASGGTTTRTMLLEEFIHHGEGLGLVSPTADDFFLHFDVTVSVDPFGVPTVISRAERFECR